MSTRSCGDCVVCCVYLRINQPELDKPGMTQCQHLVGVPKQTPNTAHYTGRGCGSCGIYETRPRVCRDYACLWLLGFGAEEDRPDRSGMLIDTIHAIENAIEAKPIGPEGSFDPERQERAVIRICRDTGKVGLVTDFYERKLVRAVGNVI